jgi:hypothetical protein
MRPKPASAIAGAQARMQLKLPVRFVSITFQNASGPTSSIPPMTMCAALQTSTSTVPRSARTRSTMLSTALASATSAGAE